MIDFLILLISLAIFLSFIVFIKSKKLTDKIVSFDTMSIISVSLFIILSISYKEPFYLDIAFIFALIGFIGTIVFARFNTLKSKYEGSA